MIILWVTIAFDYLMKAVLVGLAFFAVFGSSIGHPRSKRNFYALFAIFAFLGVYEFPAILSIDATITVRNREIAEFFRIEENAPLSELYEVEWFDIVAWLMQALVASLVGERLHRKIQGPRPSKQDKGG
ncbi:MAG: hypothetical protein ACUVXD_01085 [Thermodesulfobacteriota bacterium]